MKLKKSVQFTAFVFLFLALSLLLQQHVQANTTAEGISQINWEPKVALSNLPFGASQPIVAAAPNGTDVMVVFTGHQDGGNPPNTDPYYVFSNDNGATWTAAQRIFNSPNRSPDVHATYDGGNRPHAVWSANDEDIYYARYVSGSWKGPTVLNGLDPAAAFSPRIFATSSQIIDVVWEQRNSTGSPYFDIYHARSTDHGVSWDKPTEPIVATSFDAKLPDLFVEGNTIHVVWEEQDVNTFPTFSADVFYSVSTNGGSTWEPPVKISDPDDDNDPNDGHPEDGVAPHVYVADGRVHVLFTEQKGDAADNNQFVHHTSCSLAANCTLVKNWVADGGISGQRLGANNNSPYSVLSTIEYMQDCVFAFYHGTIGGVDTANELLFGSSSCNNGTWSSRVEMTTDSVQALRPDVATQDDRWMYVVYEQVNGSNRQIRFLRNNPEYLIYLPFIAKP